MTVAAARARTPNLRLLARHPGAERSSLQTLCGWACQFTDRIYMDTGPDWTLPAPQAGVLLEVSASLSYHGGLSKLLQKLRRSAEPLSYHLRLGVAPTAEASMLMARARDGAIACSQEDLTSQIQNWPVRLLRLRPETIENLSAVGVRQIAELLALPTDQLTRRHGTAVVHYLNCLLGRAEQPRQRFQPQENYSQTLDLGAEIERFEGLQRPLRRLLYELQGYLLSTSRSAREVLLSLRHSPSNTTDITLRLIRPTCDAVHLHGLLLERFEHLTLPAPVTALALTLLQAESAHKRQTDLFDSAGTTTENWQQVLERLLARLGEQAVLHPAMREDHRPEYATGYVTQPIQPISAAMPSRPLWLLPTPKAMLDVPQQLSGPERIEAGWWGGIECARDYYIAHTIRGARLWVFQERGRWFLHGIWA